MQGSLVAGRGGGVIFGAAVPWYFWVFSVELPSCHITGVSNFKLPSRFWKICASLDGIMQIFSLSCHLYSVQVNFNILTFWMVQDSCCHIHTHIYTGCPRKNGQNFGRVFLMLNYTDITQNIYIQSWTVTEIMAIEKCGLLGCPRTVRRPWRHTHTLRIPSKETPLSNIAMQWPWRDNEQLWPA